MRKQLDPRISHLISNNVAKNHRSFIVLVGDKGRDQIVNLHYLLSQARVSARPNVLWCYKKDLGFTTHRKKREAKMKRDVKRGIREPNEQNPFEIFVTVTDIRYTYYKESHKILGHTYGMLILQDFEAITPNLLARTIETVQGGGLVVLLLKTMSSLKQLYTMTMDVHSRYRTNARNDIVARFNERFILSLGACPDCLFLDDELNVLPISRGKDITPYQPPKTPNPEETELKELKQSLSETPIAGQLVQLAKTTSQARALLTFIDSITSKTLSSTCTLTSARGRGKSAALGLGIAAAVAHGYANIFVTSPTPENLQTTFEFIFKGFDALGYTEHLDYDILQTTNPEWGKAIVRVNIFKEGPGGIGHRQTIQYIQPADAHVLGQAELVVIDEAAAIPLPLVRELFGPYLIWMGSTINGYEGTGRSLSLKLIKGLREESAASTSLSTTPAAEEGEGRRKDGAVGKKRTNRTLHEITLITPIRYAPNDAIESWLNTVLCLSAPPSSPSAFLHGTPHPSTCQLYRVNRDTLFSFHPASELFLQRMMALYVASHYKNQPNDLQLMSDAPAHELYVLLPPIPSSSDELPVPLAVIQVALEGRISREAILEGLGRGLRAGGDMIPWLISMQFQEGRFAEMSGARIVRVATDPEVVGMGYGTRALEALREFYLGEHISLDEPDAPKVKEKYDRPGDGVLSKGASLLADDISVRRADRMPPLLERLSEIKPEPLDWLGVSFGLTGQLLRFWKRLGYTPLYIRHTASDLTGEHTCVMVRTLPNTTSSSEDASEEDTEDAWLGEFASDFRTRFLTLLSFPKFRDFPSVLGLSVLEAVNQCPAVKQLDASPSSSNTKTLTPALLNTLLTPFDLRRLESYGNNQLDYHVILDLMPVISRLFFSRKPASSSGESDKHEKSSNVTLSAVQSAILLAMGLQLKSVEDVETELNLPVNQVLALLVKVVRKISKQLSDIVRSDLEKELPAPPLATQESRIVLGSGKQTQSLEEELEEAAEEDREEKEKKERQREMIGALDLRKYAIDTSGTDWTAAEAAVASGKGKGVISVKSNFTANKKRKAEGDEGAQENAAGGEGKKGTRRGGKKVKR
ncbi:nucleolar atpase [Moniliophthora roreri MCA 2997]|uniref:RNA cytidine acetyltransferase n=2 Tax=Moniliophthora roreri TaxID=221103 RepID=V2YYB5_MONRO|nr:nucleolar atpase [Moniliophthora roreri MCA 2997]KAI3618712.1 nucleolar atpase [Moniliophthora roreri]